MDNWSSRPSLLLLFNFTHLFLFLPMLKNYRVAIAFLRSRPLYVLISLSLVVLTSLSPIPSRQQIYLRILSILPLVGRFKLRVVSLGWSSTCYENILLKKLLQISVELLNIKIICGAAALLTVLKLSMRIYSLYL